MMLQNEFGTYTQLNKKKSRYEESFRIILDFLLNGLEYKKDNI